MILLVGVDLPLDLPILALTIEISNQHSSPLGASWGMIIFHHVRAKSELKNVDEILVSQMGGGQSSFNFWCWTQKCKLCIDIFYGISCNIKHITAILNLHLEEKIL